MNVQLLAEDELDFLHAEGLQHIVAGARLHGGDGGIFRDIAGDDDERQVQPLLLYDGQRGEAVNDYGSQLRQESDGRSATIKGRLGDGPTIHITTERGSILVRKEGSAPSEDSGTAVDKGKLEKQLKDLKETEIKLW